MKISKKQMLDAIRSVAGNWEAMPSRVAPNMAVLRAAWRERDHDLFESDIDAIEADINAHHAGKYGLKGRIRDNLNNFIETIARDVE